MKIRHPIIQAPMAGAATPALAAAVSNAGGLGSLGCAEMSLDQLRAAVTTLLAAHFEALRDRLQNRIVTGGGKCGLEQDMSK